MKSGRRSARKPRREVRSYRGRGATRLGNLLPLIGGGLFLLLAAVCALTPGMRFSAALFLALTAACGLWMALSVWSGRARGGVIVRRIFALCLAALLLAFAAMELVLVRRGEQPAYDGAADAVIVLGAGVNGREPSLALQSRIDAAAGYLKRHPDAPAILCGGQGRGEEITEARAMYDGLVALGVEKNRLHLEERSTSTAENFAYSKELLQEMGLDPSGAELALVTNDFHLFRAEKMAASQGMTVHGIPAELPWWWLRANYYTREFFAVGKWLLLTAAG